MRAKGRKRAEEKHIIWYRLRVKIARYGCEHEDCLLAYVDNVISSMATCVLGLIKYMRRLTDERTSRLHTNDTRRAGKICAIDIISFLHHFISRKIFCCFITLRHTSIKDFIASAYKKITGKRNFQLKNRISDYATSLSIVFLNNWQYCHCLQIHLRGCNLRADA